MRRFIWLVAVTAAASLAAALSIALTQRPIPGSSVLYLLTVPIPFLSAGIFLLWRHPRNLSGTLLVGGTAAAMAYTALLERFVTSHYASTGGERWMSWALFAEALVEMVGVACLALLIGLFPNHTPTTTMERRFARWVWFLPLPMLIGLLANEAILVQSVTYGGFGPFENPMYVESLSWLGSPTASIRPLLGSALLLAIGLLLFRYRREEQDARRQIRWVLFGSAFAMLIGVVPFILDPILDPDSLVHGTLGLTLGAFALLAIPVSITVAIEQPEWLDVDEVIRKSFTYGALSIGIFIVYAAIAAGLGVAAGARLPLEIAIGVTAILAFAFQPARRRLQLIADRWVFGEQPTPIEAVADFDRSMRSPDAGGELAQRLADTVRRALRVRWVTVDLPPDGTATSGVPSGEATRTAAIKHGDDHFGHILCGPKISGQFKDTDVDLIDALAGQAALVVSNARLAARIVQAQEAERRRLERNIHDGAQQELVALVAKLGLARARVKADSLDEAALIELQRDARTILNELRELAQGIHPSVLTDGGLVEAVEDRCSRLPIDVLVETAPGLRTRRFNDDIEGAAYFFITEALTNVLKHSNATEARVELGRANGHLELAVTDNGCGFDQETTRLNGLAGLTDRFLALSGEVHVGAASNGGTALRGRIPVEGEA